MVEADVDVQSASGELLLDLVEGGKHFACTIDLKTRRGEIVGRGSGRLRAEGQDLDRRPGKHHVGFANFDDQLLLWVDGKI